MQSFYALTHQRFAWFSLAFISLLCLGFALYLQHVMGYQPCPLCVQERLALLAIATAGVLGFLHPSSLLTRPFAFLLWGIGSVEGVVLTVEHFELQQTLTSCGMLLPFPDWLPLDFWAPWLFYANGNCSETLWQLGGLSLVQWLGIVFVLYTLAFILFVCSIFANVCTKRTQTFYSPDR